MGGTVTYAMMQIAYYMGFDNFLLIGLDHYYPKAGQALPGTEFVAEGDDPDHFVCADGKPYFEEGKRFNNPETDKIVPYYQMFKELCEKDGKRVINLTKETHLDVFQKGDIKEWTK